MDAFSHVEVRKQHFINVFPLIDQARILFEQEKIRKRARTPLGRESILCSDEENNNLSNKKVL